MNFDYEAAYKNVVATDNVTLRERVALEVIRRIGHFDAKQADAMAEWIVGPAVKKRGPKPKALKKLRVEVAAKPKKGKRKYTKRSKFWAKKK